MSGDDNTPIEESGEPEEEVSAAEVIEEAAEPEDELAQARRRADEYFDALQRLQAEFDNYRKRVAKEHATLANHANDKLLAKLLPLLDNFERAVFVAEHTQDIDGLVKGVEMVYAEFVATLEREGLEEIEAEGQAFDPEIHEAVMEVDAPDHAPHTVVDVLRKGFRLHGKLIRPSMVKVAKG